MDGEINWGVGEGDVSRSKWFPDTTLTVGNSSCDGKTGAVEQPFPSSLLITNSPVQQKLLR